MRNKLLLLSFSAAACGARTPRSTLPVEYACGDVALVTHGKSIEVREQTASIAGGAISSAALSFRDDTGDHFVNWPQTPIDVSAVEYVVPTDPLDDATERIYDTSAGTSRADWRLVRRQVCTARGGYNDALARYLKGESLVDVAHDLELGNKEQARDLVHHAVISVQRRYYGDR